MSAPDTPTLADDVAVVLEYLSHQWLPADVKQARARLARTERCELQETGLGVSLVPSATGRLLREGAACP